jgi:CrcB protein
VSPLTWVAITLAGGAGSLSRYFVDRWVVFREHERFPYGILVVNVSGAFVLGLLTAWHSPVDVLKVAQLGFVGAFTTFSTWMLDTQRLAEDGRRSAALANVAVSLVLGLAAAWLGRTLGGG